MKYMDELGFFSYVRVCIEGKSESDSDEMINGLGAVLPTQRWSFAN